MQWRTNWESYTSDDAAVLYGLTWLAQAKALFWSDRQMSVHLSDHFCCCCCCLVWLFFCRVWDRLMGIIHSTIDVTIKSNSFRIILRVRLERNQALFKQTDRQKLWPGPGCSKPVSRNTGVSRNCHMWRIPYAKCSHHNAGLDGWPWFVFVMCSCSFLAHSSRRVISV